MVTQANQNCTLLTLWNFLFFFFFKKNYHGNTAAASLDKSTPSTQSHNCNNLPELVPCILQISATQPSNTHSRRRRASKCSIFTLYATERRYNKTGTLRSQLILCSLRAGSWQHTKPSSSRANICGAALCFISLHAKVDARQKSKPATRTLKDNCPRGTFNTNQKGKSHKRGVCPSCRDKPVGDARGRVENPFPKHIDRYAQRLRLPILGTFTLKPDASIFNMAVVSSVTNHMKPHFSKTDWIHLQGVV